MLSSMTLYDFRALDEAEQIEAFWDGILVGSATIDGYQYECRQVNDFYINFRIQSGRFYRDMHCHKNTVLIEPFLSNEPFNL